MIAVHFVQQHVKSILQKKRRYFQLIFKNNVQSEQLFALHRLQILCECSVPFSVKIKRFKICKPSSFLRSATKTKVFNDRDAIPERKLTLG